MIPGHERRQGSLWRHADFGRLWAAQAISAIGSEVTLLALPLTAALVLQASAVELGLLRALALAPSLAIGLVVGVWVDRLRRRPILVWADLGRAALLATIPIAALFAVLRIEQLLLVALLTSALTVFFDVAHLSYLPTLVSRRELADGNGKLEISRSLSLIAGAGLAGILVQTLTAPLALLIDAGSFLASAVLLRLIRAPEPPPSPRAPEGSAFWTDLSEGLRAVMKQPLLRAMAGSLCLYNLFSQWVGAVYVLYVVRGLGLSPATLGLIAAAGGIAFFVGATLTASVADRLGIGRAIVWGAGVSDAGFLFIPIAALWPAASVPLLLAYQVVASLAGPVTGINQLTLRQSLTPDHLQGRVNATMRVLALGAGPVGALVGGVVADHLGLWTSVAIGSVGVNLGFVWLLFSPVRVIRAPAAAPHPG